MLTQTSNIISKSLSNKDHAHSNCTKKGSLKSGLTLKQLTLAVSTILATSLALAQTPNTVDSSAQAINKSLAVRVAEAAEQNNLQTEEANTEAESTEDTANENVADSFTSSAPAQNAPSQTTSSQNTSSAATTGNQVTGQTAVGQTATGQNNSGQTATNPTSAPLSAIAQKVNSSEWQPGVKMTQAVGTKVQALLNWNHHGVGAVDGWWGKNTQKAMQAFQQAKGLPVTNELDQKTWEALKSGEFATKPVLISYTLTDSDVNIKTTKIPEGAEAKSKLEGMYYESVAEAMAEKFHMDISYLKQLNPNASFKAGETLTVYNPGRANKTTVTRVVADKNSQTLYAYDKQDKLVASYPTTVGSTATPSPTGTHKVQTKVSDPNYTHTDADGKQTIIPPGPNNPVGRVWIGLSKPSYGIHGSPDPERISRQASAGCIRLTNWDALALLNIIDNDATVEIK